MCFIKILLKFLLNCNDFFIKFKMMKEGVEESYRLRANMLRQEAKIAEQLKTIEIDRLKRLGKAIRAANQVREYCAMCDLQFYGHLSTHRKSEGHLDLKKFLHPKCDECTTEFHNRTEFDDHLLSPGHMKTSKTPPSYKSEEARKNRLQILTEAEETQGLREEKPKKEKKDAAAAAAKDGETPATAEGEAKSEAMETNAEADADAKKDEDDGDEIEEKNDEPEIEPILDFNDGDEIGPEIENKIPKYNFKRAVGSSMITQLVCFQCRLCNKYFDTDVTAEIHSRTYNHHRLFVKFLNEKANETKIAQKRAAAADETERLKRIKLETDAEPAAAEASANKEMYDPTEATGDDEVKENGAEEVKAPEVTPAVVTPAPVATPATPAPATPVVPAATPATPTPVAAAAPATPVATPATPAPVAETPKPTTPAQQSPAQTPNKGGNNRGRGRGGNNRRSGRYGRY